MKNKYILVLLISLLLTTVSFGVVGQMKDAKNERLNSQNLILLTSYSRLHLLLSDEFELMEDQDMLLKENSEFQRLYLQTEVLPACLNDPISAKKVFCRVKFISQPSDLNSILDAINLVVNERLESDSKNCQVDLSAESCASSVSYNSGENLTPDFKKIDRELGQ
jgi:hypothetical protein